MFHVPCVWAASEAELWLGGMAVLATFVLFSIVMLLAKRYKTCPSNRVLVIYGKSGHGHEAATCIHGGAKFVMPLIQDFAWLNLEPMQIEIPLRGALSMENIRVNVPSVFTVAIGTTPELMQNAAIRLLGMPRQEIAKRSEDIIFGQLRQVIASMQIEDINRDREKFLEAIQNSLEPELRKIGLVLINVNITDITDESGYIEAIGQKAASQAIQKARGDVADNERMGEIRVAEAERETNRSRWPTPTRCVRSARARPCASRQSAWRNSTRSSRSAKRRPSSSVQAEVKKCRARNAHQAGRCRRARRRRREPRQGRRGCIPGRPAGQEGRGVPDWARPARSKAEGAVLAEAEHIARAKAALAEAQRVRGRAPRRARSSGQGGKGPDRGRCRRRSRQAPDRGRGRCRRDLRPSSRPKLAASTSCSPRRARGFKPDHRCLRRLTTGLPDCSCLEHFDHLVEASAKAISNIKFDKVVVWESNPASGQSATASWLHNMSRTLPPMMQVMRDIGGVEIPETLATLAGVERKPAGDGRAAEKEAK